MNIPLNISLSQILMHLFNFAILFGGLYFLLYQPVKSFMAKREETYREMDARAREALAEAERYKAEAAAEREALDQELRQEAFERRQEMQASVQAQVEEAREHAREIIASARKNAEHIQEKALVDMRDEVKQLLIHATNKVTLRPGEDAFDQFLALAEEDGQ